MFAAKVNIYNVEATTERAKKELRKRESDFRRRKERHSPALCPDCALQCLVNATLMRLNVNSLHAAFLLLLSGRRNTSQQVLALVQHVLLHCASIIQVCSHLKMKALAELVQLLPVADRAVTASTTTIKNRHFADVCEREIKETELFQFESSSAFDSR